MNNKTIKIIGYIATIVGVGATLVTSWVNEKQMNEKIDEAVKQRLEQLNK